MKIIQLNAWHGKLGDAAIRFLNEHRPDIVCLQEATEIKGLTGGMLVALHDIQKRTGFEHVYFAPVLSYRFMNRTCQFGNAILSRFPMQDEKTVFIYGQYRENFDRNEGDYNIRNLQTCQIRLGDQTLTLVNHHAFHIKNPEGNDQSLQAMQKVADVLQAQSGPLIFCGDLNVSPDSSVLRPLESLRLRNLTVEHKLSNTLSPLHKLDIPVACDYIFVSPDIQVTSFGIPDELVSDHRPLILECSWPG